jgi:hypothetical protein
MSLSGTFDVFSLPEVLRMLASGGKTGTLRLEAGGRSGHVELFDGECCGAGRGGDDEPLVTNHTAAALHARLLDVAFETVREPDGAFRFAADEHPRPKPAAATPVEPVLGELEELQREWHDISTVVPSTDAIPVMATRLSDDEIVLSASEWTVLACLDGATPVHDLPARSGGSLVEVCRALAALVRKGAIDVAVQRIAPVHASAPVDEPLLAEVVLDAVARAELARETEAVEEPATEVEPETVVATDEGPEAGDDRREDAPVEGDRGAMLRLFSALRE